MTAVTVQKEQLDQIRDISAQSATALEQIPNLISAESAQITEAIAALGQSPTPEDLTDIVSTLTGVKSGLDAIVASVPTIYEPTV